MSGHFFNLSDKEILTPQLKEINGMFYRIHPFVDLTQESGQPGKSGKTVTNLPLNTGELADLTADFTPEEQDILYHRVRKPRGTDAFRMILDQESIAPVLYSMIIGKGGLGRKTVEDETKARIIFPEKGGQQQNKPIEIICHDDVQLIVCRRRLLQAAQTARFNIPFTHFLCFPVVSPAIQQAFTRFRSEVSQKCGGSRGFSPDLFQNPLKLHFTIGTFAMFSAYEWNITSDGLEECFAEGLWRKLEGGPLVCRLKGLEIMNDDPSEVDVLYAKVEDKTGRLQVIADRVYEWFMDSEPRFLQDKFDHLENVKLHCTLLNSRYRKGEEISEEDSEVAAGSGGKVARRTFDARTILQHYGDFDFGELTINEIHISQRFSVDVGGFYMPTRKLQLDAASFRSREAPAEAATAADVYGDEPTCALDAEYD